jgi:hypothetical protein
MRTKLLSLALLAAPLMAQEISPAQLFYYDVDVLRSLGIPIQIQQNTLMLCDFGKSSLVATARWTNQSGNAWEFEAFIRPGSCATKTLTEAEEPNAGGIRLFYSEIMLGAEKEAQGYK